MDDHVLTCPWHGWQYDLRTGENEFDRAIQLRTYEVRVEDGDVHEALVEVPLRCGSGAPRELELLVRGEELAAANQLETMLERA